MSFKKWIRTCLILTLPLGLHAQSKSVTGIVYSGNDSIPLIGASIYVKGTTIGTTADMDGRFSINVNSGNDTLVFSFIGMQDQQVRVGNQNRFKILLREDAYQVDEVVVTALGISRQSKSLGYSVEKIDAEELVKGNDRSFLNSLQGKVAGVNISSSSGAPGSSSRIMIRGTSSLGRSNEPLFIIDGVPVSNSFSGSTSINGGLDFGNRANDINPDDIESMTVLKGSAGTALYGSRAANGVVIITTKKGAFNKKPVISVASSMSMEEPLRLVKYQNEFGQGVNGQFVRYENMSWGPSFDDKVRIWGNQVDSAYRVKPYAALPNNVKEFFDVGRTFNNSISVSGGGDGITYYLSYSNVMSDGIFPANADTYDRNTLALRSEQKISDKLKTSFSINMIRKENNYVATGQGEQSVYNQIMQTPRDISLLELADLDNDFNNVDNYYSLYTLNPYFILENFTNNYNEKRVFYNFNIAYNIIKGLDFQARFGDDLAFGNSLVHQPVIRPEGNNEFAALFSPGKISEGSSNSSIKNMDLMLTFKRDFGDKFNVQFIVGNNVYESRTKILSAQVSSLTVENHYHISNSNEPADVSEYSAIKRLVGLYSNLDLSYNSWLFVSFAGRNDWSSTLDKSYFYPGVNMGFVFSDAIPELKNIISFGKIRAGVAQTGNDAPIYSALNSYAPGLVSDGYGFFTFPIAGVNGYELSNLLGNSDLKPELTTEYEIGADLRFLDNRIGIDLSLYQNNIFDLIWAAPISSASGFTQKTINLGKIENKGIEVLLKLTPIKLSRFQWDMSYNFSRNIDKLAYLNKYTEKVVLTGIGVSGGQQINYIARPGKPIGIFEAREVLKDSQGRIVVDNQGIPRAAEELVEYGDGNYDYTLGINNEIRLGPLTASVTFDIRQGGIMFSRTKDISAWAGTSPETLYNNRQPFIVPNSVYEVRLDEEGNPVYAENNKPINQEHLLEFWANGGYQMDGFALIDKSFIKLREVAVSYEIPKKYIQRLPIGSITLNVAGKNLYLWTPEGQYYIDPEVSTFGTDLTSNFGEYSATPSVRSVSFGLKVIL
jgi:TonB-linked SusC/RagA family outer membrane protein